MQRSFLIERAANSEIRWAEVMATRNATLYERNQRLTFLRCSKGPRVRVINTFVRSQVE